MFMNLVHFLDDFQRKTTRRYIESSQYPRVHAKRSSRQKPNGKSSARALAGRMAARKLARAGAPARPSSTSLPYSLRGACASRIDFGPRAWSRAFAPSETTPPRAGVLQLIFTPVWFILGRSFFSPAPGYGNGGLPISRCLLRGRERERARERDLWTRRFFFDWLALAGARFSSEARGLRCVASLSLSRESWAFLMRDGVNNELAGDEVCSLMKFSVMSLWG